jgi:uncharacterized membrane protein
MDYTTAPTGVEPDGLLVVNHGDHDHAPPAATDSHTRSLLKGLTWRILASSTTMVIAWLVTGHVQAALQIGGWEFFAKLLIYYAHERLWTRL